MRSISRWVERVAVKRKRLPRFSLGILDILLLLSSLSPPTYAGGVGISVEPSCVVLTDGTSRQQLAVTLDEHDGTIRDITAQCCFVANPDGVASVTPGGVVLPVADGRTVLRAIFQSQTAEVEVRVQRASWHPAVSFRTDVAPLLSKAGCNMGACHGNLNGKGGFRLSLRGDEPAFDFQGLTHDLSGRRLSRIAPEQSLIVLKPTGLIAHEGGKRFSRDSIEAQTLLSWIGSGASDDRTAAPRLKSLRAFPSERISAPGALDQQLIVTAEFDDGTSRDVTRQAAYDVSDPTRADVSEAALVHAQGPCETTIAIRYMNGRCTSRLAFPG